MAEREGFEPSVPFRIHTLSRRAPSTTRTSLQVLSTESYYSVFCQAMQQVFVNTLWPLAANLSLLCGTASLYSLASCLSSCCLLTKKTGSFPELLAEMSRFSRSCFTYSFKWYGTVVTITFSFQISVLRKNQPVWLCRRRCQDFRVSNSGIMTVI